MKPREFDDLVKQKFDQGDFEYDARNWDRLADELDGREKKKGGLLLWWIPLMGVAASVAMAFGVSTALRHGSGITNGVKAEYAQVINNTNASKTHKGFTAVTTPKTKQIQEDAIPAQAASTQQIAVHVSENINSEKNNDIKNSNNKNTDIAINTVSTDLNTNVNLASNFASRTTGIAAKSFANESDAVKKKKKVTIVNQGYYTFKEEKTPWKTPKVAIILSGGVNYGNQSNGYTLGASARRMINDHVYVEGDLAFIGTNNTVSESVYDKTITVSTTTAATGSSAVGAKAGLSKNSAADGAPKITKTTTQDIYKTVERPYNLYYAQITPTIGYKLMKRMSVGVGPDFQQMLVDNRPSASPTERGNIQVAPMFDIGFMGKTEYSVSKNIKAAVYYREGINNIITPTNKYIDRNYLQVQVKCTILNR